MHLDDLSRRQPETWKSVEELIGRKAATSYDEAVSLLVDLRDLARRLGTEAAFKDRVRELRERHSNKPSCARGWTTRALRADGVVPDHGADITSPARVPARQGADRRR